MHAKRFLGASLVALSLTTGAVHAADTINVLVESGGESLQKAIAAQFTKDTGINVNFVVVPYPTAEDPYTDPVPNWANTKYMMVKLKPTGAN
jgi:ABC-type glycerol-3-phosphate transport system substrate-binding protein